MDTSDPKPFSVLIISPHPSVHGGVSQFIETMKPHLKSYEVIPFWVGSVSGQKEGRFSQLYRLARAPFDVASLVRKHHIDVVHINPSLDSKSALRDGLILLALRLSGFRRTLVYIHGWQHKTEQRLRRIPILSHFTRWLLNGAGHIMVLAPEFKQGLQAMRIEPSRITFTHTMFDGVPLEHAMSVQPPERRTVLFMSRFVREKGVYELLDAFARIAGHYQDVDLIYAGAGAETEGLKRRAAEHKLENRVHFTGYIRGDAKYSLLMDCTVFALPTYFDEGMPVALLEAMGAGKPLLTANAGGIRHVMSDPANGVVLERVTVDTVEAGLNRLLGDADYCRKTGEHNRSYAWKHFESKVVTQEIEAVYNRIAEHSGSSL